MAVNHPTFGTICEICFHGLTMRRCAVDTDGQRWDICAGDCARQAGITEKPREDTMVFPDTRHLTASAVVLDPHARTVLLVDHLATGMWLFPGGHLEADEAPHEAVLREVGEETMVHAHLVDPNAHLSFPGATALPAPWRVAEHVAPAKPARAGRPAEPEHKHIDMLFIATAADEGQTTGPADEVAGVRWVPIDDLHTLNTRADIPALTRQALGQVLGVRGELDELRSLFAMQWQRMQSATERWRAEDPEARELIMPDLGELLGWLMAEADKARNLINARPAVRVAQVISDVTGLPVRTGPGHSDWPHEAGRIPGNDWNFAERAASDVYNYLRDNPNRKP